MALMNCPECGKEVSDKAVACIHCGFPIREYLAEIEEMDMIEAERIDDYPSVSEEDILYEKNYYMDSSDEENDTDEEVEEDYEESRYIGVAQSPSYESPSSSIYHERNATPKAKSHKWVVILAIIAFLLALEFPTWNANRINSQPLSEEELLGEWNGITFYADHTADPWYCDYLTGRWIIVNQSANKIYFDYYVTDEQVEQYYQDWIVPYADEYGYGYYPSNKDVLESIVGWSDYEIPEEGTYHFVRTENRLVDTSDDNNCIER